MKMLWTTAALAVLTFVANDALGQGPVRQGLRRTGEIAVGGTRRVAEGTGRVIQGTGQAAAGVARGVGETAAGVARGVGETAAGVARGTGQAAAGIVGATARGVDRLTPDLPLQARAGANLEAGDEARDARWRFARHNNEWWYYSPENSWMYHRDGDWNAFSDDSFKAPAGQQLATDQSPQQQFEGEHTAGYRGDDAAGQLNLAQQNQGQHHANQPMVRVDRHGREYICENGRPVYLTSHGQSQEWSAGYRGEAMNEADSPTPGISTEPQDQPAAGQEQQQTPTPAEPSSAADPQSDDAVPQNPTPQTSAGTSDASPEAPREINNNPDTAVEGDASTSGSADGDTLR